LTKFILTIGCIVFPSTLLAEVIDIQVANNQVSIQSISNNVDYTETGYGRLGTTIGTLDTESGRVPGFSLAVSRMTDYWIENGYFEAEYDYANGRTKYIGSYQGGVYGDVVTTSGAVLSNYGIRYGKGFVINNVLMLTPYAELGHHKWDRGVNYGEIYDHDYYGIGGLLQYSPISPLVLTLNVLYGNTSASKIEVISGGGSNGFSAGLGNSRLFKYGLAADYELDKNIYGKVGIEVTNFKYGISAVYPIGGGWVAWEPDSSTRNTTIKFGIGRAF